MYYVYILYATRYNKSYVGYTHDVEKRIEEHNFTAIKGYTISYRPWALIHTEAFETKTEAIKKEKYYKTGVGREIIKGMIEDFLQRAKD